MRRLAPLCVLAVSALAAAPASADYLDLWDANADQALERPEWDAGLDRDRYYIGWDDDEDANIADYELGAGLFNRFDVNDDGVLTVNEWDAGIDGWYGERAVNLEVADWDLNGNDLISRDEFVTAFGDSPLYADFTREAGYDAPPERGIPYDDFEDDMFDWFDEDDDDRLAEDETFWDTL